MKRIISSIYILFSLTSCADSPNSPVPGNSPSSQEGLESESITAMALKYQGTDAQGRKCDLYLGIHEEEHGDHEDHDHEEHEHDHHLLVKADYTTLDGHKPNAGEASFLRYKISSSTYYPVNSTQPDTELSLLSMNLKEEKEELDPNLLNTYIKNGELQQYMRIKFSKEANHENFVHALDEVLEGEANLSEEKETLNTIELLSLGLAHGDHYHFPTCFNYSPVGIEEVEFEMQEHDDHDHEDHDHNHEHKHR